MDDYIGKFLSMNKSMEQADEAKRKQEEELRKQQELQKQQQELVAQQSPLLWQELKRFIQSKIKEINQKNGTPVLALASLNPDDLVIRYRGHQVQMKYRKDGHYLSLSAVGQAHREAYYLPRIVNGSVMFAHQHNGKPVDPDGIMREIMAIFVDCGA